MFGSANMKKCPGILNFEVVGGFAGDGRKEHPSPSICVHSNMDFPVVNRSPVNVTRLQYYQFMEAPALTPAARTGIMIAVGRPPEKFFKNIKLFSTVSFSAGYYR